MTKNQLMHKFSYLHTLISLYMDKVWTLKLTKKYYLTLQKVDFKGEQDLKRDIAHALAALEEELCAQFDNEEAKNKIRNILNG